MKHFKRTIVKSAVILVVSYVLFVVLARINQEAQVDKKPNFSSSTTSVRIYLVKLDDNGQVGEKIGCGDSLVPVGREVPISDTMIESALLELFALKADKVGQGELYNALSSSKLTVEKVIVKNGNAQVQLAGKFSIGGVCDAPRVKSQLTQTILQFPNINSVDIYINKIPLDEILSGK